MVQFSVMDSGGYIYGINWAQPAESIGEGELFQAENCEYSTEDGSLQTMAGIRARMEMPDDIESLFFDVRHNLFYFSSAKKLYSAPMSFATHTGIGGLSGDGDAIYTLFGDTVLVASGGKLQYVEEGELKTIDASPSRCDYVTVRQGRVLTYATNSDRLCYSAIGDFSGWENVSGNVAEAQYIDIGYKDPGNIVALDFLTKVIMVYKAGGRAYKIVGEPTDSDYSVQPVSQTAFCQNMRSVANVDGKSYYLGSSGFKSFVPTNAYGDIAPFDEGLNINAAVSLVVDSSAALWHIPCLSQIWLKAQNDRRIYMYHYAPRYQDGRGAFTIRNTSHILHDVCTVGNDVYVAYGCKIGMLSRTTDKDDGEQIVTSIKGQNKLASKHSILVMNRLFVSHNILPGRGTLKCGKKVKPIILGTDSPYANDDLRDASTATEPVYSDNYSRSYKVGGGSNKNVQVTIIIDEGAISLRQFRYEYIEV